MDWRRDDRAGTGEMACTALKLSAFMTALTHAAGNAEAL
jgi:hypothetical protein